MPSVPFRNRTMATRSDRGGLSAWPATGAETLGMWVRLGPSGAASIGDLIAAMETGRAALRPNENQRLTHALLAAALAHINRLKDPAWMLPVARDVARILAPSRIAERRPHPGVDHLAPTTRTRAWPESFGLALGIATARYPARRQPLNQQFDQRGRRLGLPFGWDLPHQGLHRPLHKNSEHRVRIHADRARHGDCLCEEIRRVGSVGGNPLNPTDELIDGRIWSVCHDPRMTSPGAMRQEQKVPTDPAAWPRLSPQCRQFTLNDRQNTRLSARKAPLPGKRVARSGTTLHS
jgi:hypothetical protein